MKIILKLLSIIAIILLQSCDDKDSSPCRNSETNIYYNIADSNKAKIPYSGTDTLVFISDQGDTATLIGQGKKTFYVTSTRNNSGNADCQWLENKNFENFEINFKNYNNFFSNVSFSIFKYNDNLGSYPNTTSMKFEVDNIEIASSNIEYISSLKSFQDSILLNGKFVGGVYLGFNTYNTLFNFEKGILKFNYDNKNWIKWR
jgi:hypothetical protein